MNGETSRREVGFTEKWNRKFLNSYWVGVLLYALLTTIDTLTKSAAARPMAWIWIVLIPGCGLVIIACILEVLQRRSPSAMPYCLTTGSQIAVFVACVALRDLTTTVVILPIPLMLCAVYLRRKLVVTGATLTGVSLILLVAFVYGPGHQVSLADVLVLIAGLILSVITAALMVGRGRELLAAVKENAEAKRDLMIENVVMERQAKLDPLTELYNRWALRDHLSRLVEVCKQHQLDLHMAVIDIDDFKRVNDTYGHDVGDEVLCGVAATLRELMPLDWFIARYGGEEFVVLAAGVPGENFVSLMETVRQAFEGVPYDKGATITVSIGIHTLRPGENGVDLFRRADQSLYRSKEAGKNQVNLHVTDTLFDGPSA